MCQCNNTNTGLLEVYLQNIKGSNQNSDTYHREKPIEKFIEEVKHAIKEYKIDFIYFTDESFLSMRREKIFQFH